MKPDTEQIRCCVIGIVIRTKTRNFPVNRSAAFATPYCFLFMNSASFQRDPARRSQTKIDLTGVWSANMALSTATNMTRAAGNALR
jgi:hypothetical protein